MSDDTHGAPSRTRDETIFYGTYAPSLKRNEKGYCELEYVEVSHFNITQKMLDAGVNAAGKCPLGDLLSVAINVYLAMEAERTAHAPSRAQEK